MDIREDFEKLPHILCLMQYVTCFDGLKYVSDNQRTEDYLNGAWDTYQEQQKKIDEFRSHLRTVLDEYYLTDYYNSDTCRSAELLLLMPSIYTDDELKIEIESLLK